MTNHRESRDQTVFGAERAKAFIDAVVAIAMTLLILPLMESVGESAARDEGALGWVADHQSQLVSFVLSFVIIAMFWINHHRLFARVERVSVGLLWIVMPWLLSIVWLPVATAITGQMDDRDTLAKVLYIGSMVATSLLSMILRIYLHAHPALHESTTDDLRRGISVDLSMALLFALSLVIAILFPTVGYFALFLMMFTGPMQKLLGRLLRVRQA